MAVASSKEEEEGRRNWKKKKWKNQRKKKKNGEEEDEVDRDIYERILLTKFWSLVITDELESAKVQKMLRPRHSN